MDTESYKNGYEDVLKDFPYGIVVLEGNYVRHICLYPEEPTAVDAQALVEELETDPEHGLVGENLREMNFCPATGELLQKAMDTYAGKS